MIFKLCFNEQIHRCPKSPSSLEGLLLAVQQTFKDATPSNFSVSYVDQAGDAVFLNTEEDFAKLVAGNPQDNKSVKIYITSKEVKSASEQNKPEDFGNNGNMQESFQILSNNENAHDASQNGSFFDGIESTGSVVIKRPQDLAAEAPKVVDQKEEPSVLQQEHQQNLSGVIEVSHIKLFKDEVPEQALAGHVEQKAEKLEPVQVASQADSFVSLRNDNNNNKEEVKEAEVASPDVASKVVDDQHIDLSDKKVLQAFIIQTIEEAMPQLMANYLSRQEDQKKKDSNSTGFSIANVVEKVSKGVEKIIIGERKGLNAKIVTVEKMVPELITTRDDEVSNIVIVRNFGTVPLPANTLLQCVAGARSYIASVPPLEPRKEAKVTLRTVVPKKAGNYSTKWRFLYSDERNVSQSFGDEFELKFSVQDKKYSNDVVKKANQLKELLPETSLETYLEFVNQEPNKPIEVLIEEFLMNNPSV